MASGPNISQTSLQAASIALDQALYNHEQWAEALIRNLTCGLPHDSRDMVEDAHRHCRFGYWCDNEAPDDLKSHPAFQHILTEHQRMHAAASQVLLAHKVGKVDQFDYDNFSTSMRRLRFEIATLRREIDQSMHNLDPLTSALNRLGMLTRLREQYELVKRGVQSCMIAMIDIDHFKTVNDSFGHAAGDRALASLVKYIKDHVRPYDLLFRYGGEEFLLCAPNLDETTGRVLTERLREDIAKLLIEAPDGRTFSITISVRLTVLDPSILLEQCVERADRAMYAAKAAGRNCTRVWDASMT